MPYNISLKCGQPKLYDNIYLTSNNILRDYHIEKLFNSADGKGIRSDSHYYFINIWVGNTTNLLSGRDYVDSIKLKDALLYIKFR